MPRFSEKQEWRRKQVLECVWKHRDRGGITVEGIKEGTAPEGRKTGVGGNVLYSVLWSLMRKGLIVATWLPIGKRKGARYVVLPGPNAYKMKEHARERKPEEVQTPKETWQDEVRRLVAEGRGAEAIALSRRHANASK